MKKTLAVLVLTFFTSLVTAQNYFNVKDYGATGNGKKLEHKAINRTIQACASAGGGTVYFPPGIYHSGSIRLKSNITLSIDPNATILGTGNQRNAYDIPDGLDFKAYQDFGHSTWKNALIWGIGLENIAITGGGTIDGGKMTGGKPRPGGGDKSISLKNCRNITIKDIKIHHGGHFAILPTGCNNMVIDNVTVDTQRDGINIDCCKNVRISNCVVNSDDDGICLKSSYALGKPVVTENVTITNCTVSGFQEGSVLSGEFIDKGPHRKGSRAIKRIGRIKFGTESNGGFKNITISNCTFDTCWGIALESVDGGVMENVNINNISMTDVFDAPLFIRLGRRNRGPEGLGIAEVRNINISNVTATVRYNNFGSILSGLPGKDIENVTLDNITIIYPGGGTEEMAERKVPENETGGPEPTMFGDMPSFGLYCRHIDGLTLSNIRLISKEKDLRPAVIFDDVKDPRIINLDTKNPAENSEPLIMKNCENVKVYNCRWYKEKKFLFF